MVSAKEGRGAVELVWVKVVGRVMGEMDDWEVVGGRELVISTSSSSSSSSSLS